MKSMVATITIKWAHIMIYTTSSTRYTPGREAGMRLEL